MQRQAMHMPSNQPYTHRCKAWEAQLSPTWLFLAANTL